MRYDLIVLGGGAAGEKGAAQAAYFGKRVAVVDASAHLGGATAGTTVPSKTLRETAVTLSGVAARRLHGVDVSLRGRLSVQDFLRHERSVKAAERARARQNLERHGIELVRGFGRFEDAHTITVERLGQPPRRMQADVFLVATGSRPRRPAEYPDHPRIYDSDTILQMTAIPRSLAVIGGGVIGCEYACIFAALGIDVHLVHGRDALLDFMDADVSAGLATAMRAAGVALHMPARVEAITADDRGVTVALDDSEVRVDATMLAVGRCANVERLGLEAAGVQTGKRNHIIVDHEYRSTAPSVFAAGDVIGAPALASTGMEQARFAMIHALQLPNYKGTVAPILPVGIYTIPECSSAGLRPEDCEAQGIPYVSGVARYDQNVRGMIIGDQAGFLKLVFHRDTMKLLGVHVLGEIASEVVHIGLVALAQGATGQVFIDTCFNYPTLGELYKYATYDAMGQRQRD